MVGFVSEWLELDSDDEWVRLDSELVSTVACQIRTINSSPHTITRLFGKNLPMRHI